MTEQDKIIILNSLKKISNLIDDLYSKHESIIKKLQESITINGKIIEYEKINDIKKNNLKVKNEIASHIENIMNNYN